MQALANTYVHQKTCKQNQNVARWELMIWLNDGS